MQKTFPRIRVLRNSAAVAVALIGVSLLAQLPVAIGATEARADANEAVRLINGSRAAAGKSALKWTSTSPPKRPTAPSRARTRAAAFPAGPRILPPSARKTTCSATAPRPSYQVSTTKFIDTLRAKLGYGAASVGEIIGMNGGYGSGKFLYTYKGWSTWTYSTAGHIVAAWMGSSGHAPIILGSYDRVGCGAWSSGGSTIFYDCIFAAGGPAPGGVAAPPSKSPFGDAAPDAGPDPGSDPRPSGRHPEACHDAGRRARSLSDPTPTPTPTPSPTPSPTPTATPTAAPSPSASEPVAAQLRPSAVPSSAAGADSMPASTLGGGRDGPMTVASGGAMIVGSLGGLLLLFRRRRKAADRAS